MGSYPSLHALREHPSIGKERVRAKGARSIADIPVANRDQAAPTRLPLLGRHVLNCVSTRDLLAGVAELPIPLLYDLARIISATRSANTLGGAM
jgi:hypothetical protein